MKKLVKLVRLSSKEAFLKLRNIWPIYCSVIKNNFEVTNLFLRHISWSSKNREIYDVIERLSCISLIEKISFNSSLVEIRENVTIENKRFFKKTFKVKSSLKDFDFFLILWEKENWKIILISIFLNFFTK